MKPGIAIEFPFALVVAMIVRCEKVKEPEARELAAELIAIIAAWHDWCATHPDHLTSEIEEADVSFAVLRTAVGCWPRAADEEEESDAGADESIWLMGRLSAVSDELYERYLRVCYAILGEALARELSEEELELPKERLQ
jgi:hypothetical protein